MKVKDIVEKTKKYNDIQDLIDNIEKALKDFDKMETVGVDTYYEGGTVTISSFTHGFIVGDSEKKTTVNVNISSGVSKLIRDDMKALLKNHLKTLKAEQEALEL